MTKEPTKKETSITSLRNSAKQLQEVYAAIDRSDAAIKTALYMLGEMAEQMGDVYVPIYDKILGRIVPNRVKDYIAEIELRLTQGKIND